MLHPARSPLPRGLLSRALFITVALLCACSGSSEEAPAIPPSSLPAPAEPLQLVQEQALSDRLSELTVYSPQMQRQTPLRVLLPAGYDDSRRLYPVIYLLHGCCGNGRGYASWTEQMDVEAFTRNLPVIVVMPDGGDGGMYSDWYNQGAFGPPRWESYHIRELLPWIEQRYRVRRDRSGRMLMGISMGGHGAMVYAAKYPDLFASSAALSPAVDTNTWAGGITASEAAKIDGGKANDIWGSRGSEEVRWRGHNPVDLAENLSGVSVFLRTGNGREAGSNKLLDLVESVVHLMATNMHLQLQALGIAHVFEDYGSGTHTLNYWLDDIHQLLPQQLALAEAQQGDAPPASFNYRSIDAQFSVWAWRVEIQRDVLEFARLGEVSASGFTLSGSGRAQVQSAALYLPLQTYVVNIDGVTQLLSSDVSGRLHFDIDLGPSRKVQQYRWGSPNKDYLQTRRVTVQRT